METITIEDQLRRHQWIAALTERVNAAEASDKVLCALEADNIPSALHWLQRKASVQTRELHRLNRRVRVQRLQLRRLNELDRQLSVEEWQALKEEYAEELADYPVEP